MLAESSSMFMTFVAAIGCTLTVCGVCVAAGRWRGNFDGHTRRLENLENESAAFNRDIYARLGKIDIAVARITEQLAFCHDRGGDTLPRSRDPPK